MCWNFQEGSNEFKCVMKNGLCSATGTKHTTLAGIDPSTKTFRTASGAPYPFRIWFVKTFEKGQAAPVLAPDCSRDGFVWPQKACPCVLHTLPSGPGNLS